jgi:hypothetical protein
MRQNMGRIRVHIHTYEHAHLRPPQAPSPPTSAMLVATIQQRMPPACLSSTLRQDLVTGQQRIPHPHPACNCAADHPPVKPFHPKGPSPVHRCRAQRRCVQRLQGLHSTLDLRVVPPAGTRGHWTLCTTCKGGAACLQLPCVCILAVMVGAPISPSLCTPASRYATAAAAAAARRCDPRQPTCC